MSESALPESLARFRTELEDAIRRELDAQATARSNGRGACVLRAEFVTMRLGVCGQSAQDRRGISVIVRQSCHRGLAAG